MQVLKAVSLLPANSLIEIDSTTRPESTADSQMDETRFTLH